MDIQKFIWPVVFIVIFVGLVGALSGFGGPQGDSVGSGQTVGNFNNTGVGGNIQPALAALFTKAGNDTNVPDYFLAAINNQECGQVNSLSNDILTELINNNEPNTSKSLDPSVAPKVCDFDNGSNVWGPMQFQYMTFYGFPTGRKFNWSWLGHSYTDQWASSFVKNNPSFNPSAFPKPLAGKPGDQAASIIQAANPDSAIGSRPATIISLKDSVYAAAIYLRTLARRSVSDNSPWTDEQLEKASCGYYGACADVNSNYWQSVKQKIENFKSKLGS